MRVKMERSEIRRQYARLKTAADLVRGYSAYYPRIIRGYSAPYQTSSARAAFWDTFLEVLLPYPGQRQTASYARRLRSPLEYSRSVVARAIA